MPIFLICYHLDFPPGTGSHTQLLACGSAKTCTGAPLLLQKGCCSFPCSSLSSFPFWGALQVCGSIIALIQPFYAFCEISLLALPHVIQAFPAKEDPDASEHHPHLCARPVCFWTSLQRWSQESRMGRGYRRLQPDFSPGLRGEP